jgi:hypothetical protein
VVQGEINKNSPIAEFMPEEIKKSKQKSNPKNVSSVYERLKSEQPEVLE